MTDEEPRPTELSRRIDEMGRRMDAGFRDMNARLSDLPTEKTLLALLATRDTEIATVREDVKDVVAAIARETAERRAQIEAERTARETQAKEDRSRADRTRQFVLTFGLSCAVAVVGLGAFVLNIFGTASS